MAVPRPPELAAFLRPLRVNPELARQLSRYFRTTFTALAAESQSQFLPTPISESMLRRGADGSGPQGP